MPATLSGTNQRAAVEATLDRQLQTLIVDAAEQLQAEARDLSFASPRGGVWYPHDPGPASAPGEAPAVQTGAYTEGIRVEVRGPLLAEVVFPFPGIVLELGSVHMAPRPHILRAVMALISMSDRLVQASLTS